MRVNALRQRSLSSFGLLSLRIGRWERKIEKVSIAAKWLDLRGGSPRKLFQRARPSLEIVSLLLDGPNDIRVCIVEDVNHFGTVRRRPDVNNVRFAPPTMLRDMPEGVASGRAPATSTWYPSRSSSSHMAARASNKSLAGKR
jgi:hypothetical protein